MLTVYFGLKNGSMITNRELVNIAYICDGLIINPENKEAVLDYAERCKSVKGVINRPSVKHLVLHGYRVQGSGN